MDAVDARGQQDVPVEIKETSQGTVILNGRDKWFVFPPGRFGDINLVRVLNTTGDAAEEKTKMYEVNTTPGRFLSLVVYEGVSKTIDLTRPIDNVTGQVLVQDGEVVAEGKQEGLLRAYRDVIAPSLQQLQLGDKLDKLGSNFKSSLTAPYKIIRTQNP